MDITHSAEDQGRWCDRLTVQLEPAQRAAVGRYAVDHHRSVSSVVREAIDVFVRQAAEV